jgi:hypothetical protein
VDLRGLSPGLLYVPDWVAERVGIDYRQFSQVADAMACRSLNYTNLKRVCVPILFWVCVPRIPCVRNMGALGIRPGAPALKPVILTCFALISRPYKRSNLYPRPIKWPMTHWQALDFMIDCTAQKRGTPSLRRACYRSGPFVCCEMP